MMPALQRIEVFRRFIDQVEVERRSELRPAALAANVASHLQELLQFDNWLPEEYTHAARDHYAQHVLHVAPDGGFSVVSLVWRPGQATPVHDHVSWCVVGVYRGDERETRYHLHEDDDGSRFLTPVSRSIAHRGITAYLVPPLEDIHEVACEGHEQAISIHVYGADIGRLGSSVNHRFDLPSRRAPESAKRLAWRQIQE